MGLIPEQSHLTVTNPSLETMRAQTHPGMAHFAASGPPQRTCRECKFWTGCGFDTGYYAKRGNRGGEIKPRACQKYRTMMQEIGPAVPHNIRACKYFEENISPPTMFAKG